MYLDCVQAAIDILKQGLDLTDEEVETLESAGVDVEEITSIFRRP